MARKLMTSVKAILVRNFNWRMGNLHRLYHSTHCLDGDLKNQVMGAIQEQMRREQVRHDIRLGGTLIGICVDRTHDTAIWEADRNKAENKRHGK